MDHKNRRNKGITLIELLVVILIVAVLAAVAIPSYRAYMQRARRADAKTALEQLRASQEMYRAERGFYAISIANTLDQMGVTARSGDYNITLTVALTNSFTARATPWAARQVSDGWLAIDHLGNKCDQAAKCYPDINSKWTK